MKPRKTFKPQVFLRLGDVTVTREDERNWTVTKVGEEEDFTWYYPTLAGAIKRAASLVSDSKGKDLKSWLREYESVTRQLEAILENSPKSKNPKNLRPLSR